MFWAFSSSVSARAATPGLSRKCMKLQGATGQVHCNRYLDSDRGSAFGILLETSERIFRTRDSVRSEPTLLDIRLLGRTNAATPWSPIRILPLKANDDIVTPLPSTAPVNVSRLPPLTEQARGSRQSHDPYRLPRHADRASRSRGESLEWRSA